METRWLYRTSETLAELREASKGTCVIPMGCVEKHGLHLPLGADIIEASNIAYRASQLETVCVFPDHIFGDMPGSEYIMPDGTITLSFELGLQLLDELCREISRNGFKKIILLNGHGGNRPLIEAFQRCRMNRPHDYLFVYLDITLPAPHLMAEILLEKGSGSIPELEVEDEELLIKYHEEKMIIGHACMGETALLMGICPENVHLDRLGIEDGKHRHLTDHLTQAGFQFPNWSLNYPNAYSADDPYGCNERIGKAAIRLAAESAAKSFKVFKDDEVLAELEAKRKRGN